MHVIQPRENSRVAHRRVRHIEQTHLQQLVWDDVGYHHRADVLPRWALVVHEIILNHPVLVRLAHHRPVVLDPSLRHQRRDVFRRRRGGDTIDHRGRVSHLRLQPNDELVEIGGADAAADELLCGARDARAAHVAVVRKVIAGHEGEGAKPAGESQRGGGADDAERRGLFALGNEGLGIVSQCSVERLFDEAEITPCSGTR